MSLKLYVDDLRAAPEGWHLARTVTEAIRILATQDVEEVSLDHDICHRGGGFPAGHEWVEAYSIACAETFEPVARYLAAIEFSGKITLHTGNAVGAAAMKSALTCYGTTHSCKCFDVTVALSQGNADQL